MKIVFCPGEWDPRTPGPWEIFTPDCCQKARIEPASGTAKINKPFLYQEFNQEGGATNGKSSYTSSDGKYAISNTGGKWFIAPVARRWAICDTNTIL